MSSTSPFSIPHIVDSICDHLNLDDIYNCRKVCKDWSDVFAPYEWRSLHMATEYDHWGPTSPEKRNLILKHAHRIKSLTIRQNDIWLLQGSCLNFKRLAYVHGKMEFRGFLFDVMDRLIHNFGLANIGLIPFLKNCCPLLEDLSLPSFPEEDCETLMKTIGAHCPKLQYLRLNDDDFGASPFGSEIDHFVYITQPLKFLKIDLDYRHDTTVLEPLRRNGSDALEALEFRNTAEYDLSEYIPPYDWFPNLKTVNYHKSDSKGLEVHLWTRPLEITANDDRYREDVREYYTSMVNMSH
ncbi:hypothetical protein BGX24_006245 [Mortierella sp. AD032]|nr:hypothetical protein BGX24_006245 [Mortierella sp. AD032]